MSDHHVVIPDQRDGHDRPDLRPDNIYVQATLNRRLMHPSERRLEHELVKDYMRKETEAKSQIWEATKQQRKIERLSSDGIPPFANPTALVDPLRKKYDQFEKQREETQTAFRRSQTLIRGEQTTEEAPLWQTRKVDANEQFGFRFLNTHARIWPEAKVDWNIDRAKRLRSFDVRGKDYNFINHCYNKIEGLRKKDTPA